MAEESTSDSRPTGLSRRSILVGGAVGVGLVAGWMVWPRGYRPDEPTSPDERAFNAWLRLSPDGVTTLAMPQAELGQGVSTLLAQIAADELGADWRTVAVQPATANPLFANIFLAEQWAPSLVDGKREGAAKSFVGEAAIPELARRENLVLTGGSSSQRAFEGDIRRAAASVRVRLAKAAARVWGGDWTRFAAEDGFIVHGKKRLPFAKLVEAALDETAPDDPPLRVVANRPLAGKDLPRLDAPSKIDGSANFAADIRLPDMVFASIRRGPFGDTTLKSIEEKALEGKAHIHGVMRRDDFVAVAAENWWAANAALDTLKPKFETRGPLVSSDSIKKSLADALKSGKAFAYAERGETADVFGRSDNRVFRAAYSALPAVHMPLETRSATARIADGKIELWLASQAPEAARAAVAEATGYSVDDIVIYPVMAGGSFGRNLDPQIAADAAMLAQHFERPVQLTYSRAEDILRGPFRAPAAAKLTGSIDIDGQMTGLSIRLAAPAFMREQMDRLVNGADTRSAMRAAGDQFDALALQGAEPIYAIPNLSITHHPAWVGIPTGRMRGSADSYTCFFIEGFIDELARQSGAEPLSFRMRMLGGQTRMARCLAEAADMAGWDGGAENSGMGLACHVMRGSYIALVLRARTDETGLRVERISATVDCGRLTNPDLARQQIEGGIVFGLAQAVGGATGFNGGLAEARRIRDIGLPYLADIPEVQVEFVRSEDEPGGIGELGVPPVAPALASALYSAAKIRLRELPLLSTGL